MAFKWVFIHLFPLSTHWMVDVYILLKKWFLMVWPSRTIWNQKNHLEPFWRTKNHFEPLQVVRVVFANHLKFSEEKSVFNGKLTSFCACSGAQNDCDWASQERSVERAWAGQLRNFFNYYVSTRVRQWHDVSLINKILFQLKLTYSYHYS